MTHILLHMPFMLLSQIESSTALSLPPLAIFLPTYVPTVPWLSRILRTPRFTQTCKEILTNCSTCQIRLLKKLYTHTTLYALSLPLQKDIPTLQILDRGENLVKPHPKLSPWPRVGRLTYSCTCPQVCYCMLTAALHPLHYLPARVGGSCAITVLALLLVLGTCNDDLLCVADGID
jgi:hypothetical protein